MPQADWPECGRYLVVATADLHVRQFTQTPAGERASANFDGINAMNDHAPIGLPVLLPHTPDAMSADKSRVRVCAMLTSFNRREKTLECLEALSRNLGLEQVGLSVVLVDDGSTDGTSEAVKSAFPWVEIVRGDGSLFWCRGMYTAWKIALQGNYDYYLWLNDDTRLRPDAVARLLACEQSIRSGSDAPVIVVGSTVDEHTGKLTYGGERRASWWMPISMVKVYPGEQAQSCESMNGNIVLVPAASARLVGNLDPVFEHAMGDTDYALRAHKLRVGVWVAPGFYGECSDNAVRNTFRDHNLSLSKRWRQIMSRKGLPWRSWLIMTYRHTGFLWPIYFLWPYIRTVLGGVLPRFKS